jgi:hypothetical protein
MDSYSTLLGLNRIVLVDVDLVAVAALGLVWKYDTYFPENIAVSLGSKEIALPTSDLYNLINQTLTQTYTSRADNTLRAQQGDLDILPG